MKNRKCKPLGKRKPLEAARPSRGASGDSRGLQEAGGGRRNRQEAPREPRRAPGKIQESPRRAPGGPRRAPEAGGTRRPQGGESGGLRRAAGDPRGSQEVA